MLPAFSVGFKVKNSKLQNLFLQPTQEKDRQGEKNSNAFLKAKVIQASGQLILT